MLSAPVVLELQLNPGLTALECRVVGDSEQETFVIPGVSDAVDPLRVRFSVCDLTGDFREFGNGNVGVYRNGVDGSHRRELPVPVRELQKRGCAVLHQVHRVDRLLRAGGDQDGSFARKRVVGFVADGERPVHFAAVGSIDRDPESGVGRKPHLPRAVGFDPDGARAGVAGDVECPAAAFRAYDRLGIIVAAPPPSEQ